MTYSAIWNKCHLESYHLYYIFFFRVISPFHFSLYQLRKRPHHATWNPLPYTWGYYCQSCSETLILSLWQLWVTEISRVMPILLENIQLSLLNPFKIPWSILYITTPFSRQGNWATVERTRSGKGQGLWGRGVDLEQSTLMCLKKPWGNPWLCICFTDFSIAG